MTPTKVARRQVDALDAAERLGLSAAEQRRFSAASAMQIFAHRIGRELAAACHLTEDEIHDWGNAGRDRRGPHLKLVQLTERALEEGVGDRRAFVLVDWVEQQLGRVAVSLPEESEPLDIHDIPAFAREFAEAMELLADVVDRKATTSVDVQTIASLRRELHDLVIWGHRAIARLDAHGGRP